MMSRVRGTGGKAEVALRSLLWRRGHRFRLQVSGMTGRPDIVFTRARVVVFVDGDFWHARALREGGETDLRQVIRGPNFDWWKAKLQKNAIRDRMVTEDLTRSGWRVIRVWESDLIANPQSVVHRIDTALKKTRRRRSKEPLSHH
jgi:DNA mismatch endonuclease (patch repair protein)